MNINKNIPFELDKGILFEDSGNTLIWGSDLIDLNSIDNPEVNEQGTVYKWENKKCFGGQIVNVTVVRDDYHNNSGKLEFVDFEQGRNDPWAVYRKFSELFKSECGEPSESIIDHYDRPTELWNIDLLQIIVGVGERFVEFEIFGIHYGKRFWNLDSTKENNENPTMAIPNKGFIAKLKNWFS